MSTADLQQFPTFRATIVRGRMTLLHWHPGLMAPWGPRSVHFRSRDRAGVTIADLTVHREAEERPELLVRLLCGEDRPDAKEVIVPWAAALGYRRVWLPDLVVTLEDDAAALGSSASTRCTACRARWEDSTVEFWKSVRSWGIFPLSCPLCGSDLPQWEVSGGVQDRAPA